VQESAAAQALSAFSTIARVDLSGTFRIDRPLLVNRRALRARKLARQHFLK
jgi:hypothetical protein